ncbi:LruC domain-containing protein [Enterovibrio norvegicus]|uniref:LruC domain-containing protein n=2 Tax=Enterovibrio norvegicus TaxID=188144 RepID=A0A1I5K7F1_9GAMM|nr:LruC domain-containing protein [Enterovibrio norvegicus]SFO80551.1 LruC domain-containing protein [Enterovibrio norvegicus DSM 15893]
MRTYLKLLSLAMLFPTAVIADEPFDTCPSKGFLFQSSPSKVFGINLATGGYSELAATTGLNSHINAVGFNDPDRYIYGFDHDNANVVRIGKNYTGEQVAVSGLPEGINFISGDVQDNIYYLHRRELGLFKIDLSPLATDPSTTLTAEAMTSNMGVIRASDVAISPIDNKMYLVDNNDYDLYQVDLTTGDTNLVTSMIPQIGVPAGGFGAIYFDVNGNLYLSRNSDGSIFRANLSDTDDIALGDIGIEFFATGPASNQNDGARCANAPVIDEDSTIDFGDAPDSYKTLLASNGPRHEINTGFYLGTIAPDSEGDGFVSPLDDNKAGLSDEDGVGFVTALEAGKTSLISVNASQSGYLSAWIDWNGDGDFEDSGENIIDNNLLSSGANTLSVAVPADAEIGSSWSRFRFSEDGGLDFFGGATTGEVEDHPVTIMEDGSSLRHYPSESGYATVAFEDNWPKEGDYDMNDAVIRFRITETLNEDDEITRILIKGYLAAYGAGYHNGFAFRLPGLNRNDINAATTQSHNMVLQETNGLESISNEAIFIVSDDLKQKLPAGCMYYRTAQHCQEAISFEFEIDVYFNEGVDTSSLVTMPYDPFMFATPGAYVRDGLWYNPGRGLEIHLADQAPTEQFDTYWYGWWSDDSNPGADRYFKTSDNHPWALLINDAWSWPREHVDLVDAYSEFAGYAESSGDNNQLWYLLEKATADKTYSSEE